jgi:hypothetical protein
MPYRSLKIRPELPTGMNRGASHQPHGTSSDPPAPARTAESPELELAPLSSASTAPSLNGRSGPAWDSPRPASTLSRTPSTS